MIKNKFNIHFFPRLFKTLFPCQGHYITECPTTYWTRQFFDNFTTNEDIATKFEADLPHCVRSVATS
jgi:hypothetical protein